MRGIFATIIGSVCGGLILAAVIVNTVNHLPGKPIRITTGHAR